MVAEVGPLIVIFEATRRGAPRRGGPVTGGAAAQRARGRAWPAGGDGRARGARPGPRHPL